MATTTTNYKLTKPDIKEKVNVGIINQNMDILDFALKEIENESSNITPITKTSELTNDSGFVTESYVNTQISNLVDSAPDTMNTLNELATAISNNESVIDTLDSAITNKVDKVSGKGLSTNDYTTVEKTKLGGIATGAEVNQNAFSNVVVDSTTISADSKTDSLTLVGSNVTLTPDATNDKVTIGITKDNVTTALGYTPPTTNTTYGVATSSALGLVKSGTDITVDSSGNVSVNDDSHNHVISNVDGLQSSLDTKLQLQSDSGLEVGSYIDFHATEGIDYDARLMAESNKLNCFGYFYCSDRIDAGGKATLFTDGEGGNVELKSPDGSLGMQMDLFNNDIFRIYVYETNPWAYKNEIVLGKNGIITSSGIQLRPTAYQSDEPSASIPGMIWIG